MKILAKPAFSNKSKNPYNYLLYSQLEESEGCEVEEFSPLKALVNRYDILHMHWPDIMLSERSIIFSVMTVLAFLLLVKWMKLKGTRVVWTVHNLSSHDYPYKSDREQKFERWYMNRFAKLLDGVIGLSETSLEEATAEYPVLVQKQSFVIPHGHYKGVYPNSATREVARDSDDRDKFMIGYFGQIRPYKNVPQLIKVYQDLEDNDTDLLIAGNPVEQYLDDDIRRLAGDSSRITLKLEFIPDEELQFIFGATDLMVIPYQNVLNSGSVLLSLSFDTPVLVPEQGSMAELQRKIGADWVQTYTNGLTAHDLQEALEVVKNQSLETCEAIDQFGWDRIARKTAKAFQQLRDS